MLQQGGPVQLAPLSLNSCSFKVVFSQMLKSGAVALHGSTTITSLLQVLVQLLLSTTVTFMVTGELPLSGAVQVMALVF